jgi:aspartate racemase
MRPVGILGGMGPEATVLLMRKVLDAVEARDDADHVPLIVHQAPQVPSRIAHLIEGTGPDPTPVLQDMARALQAAGASALAMPCNTAHAYAPAIRDATPLPFLDMTQATARTLAAQGARRIGLLASPATRLARVFETPFAAHGLTPVFPDPDDEVLTLIRAVKRGQRPETLAPDLTRIAETLAKTTDTLCIACTELSLIAPHLPEPPLDSLDVLVSEIVAFATNP